MSEIKATSPYPGDAKKVFLKKGACSHTFYFLLNRAFGHLSETEERASDSLAGGIMANGYQCGMLWGSVLGTGAEAYRQHPNITIATRIALRASMDLVKSFHEKTGTINCREIAGCNWKSNWSMAKYFLSGRFWGCYRLAADWAPEAIDIAARGVGCAGIPSGEEVRSCSSEVVRMLGGSDKEKAAVSGFAGGLGLSGGGCGALAAAIWFKSLEWSKANPGKSTFNNPDGQKVMDAFLEESGGEYLCSKISGRHFNSIEDHSSFLQRGGCSRILESLTGI